MLAGARLGLEQEVSVPVARSLVSDGRAEYVDAWRNPVVNDAPAAAESNPLVANESRKPKRGSK